MSELNDDEVVNNRMMPAMTWNGALVGPLETATHYLHLTAFPCQECNGPVIAGSLGTRHDNITQETDIRLVGAIVSRAGAGRKRFSRPLSIKVFARLNGRGPSKHLLILSRFAVHTLWPKIPTLGRLSDKRHKSYKLLNRAHICTLYRSSLG